MSIYVSGITYYIQFLIKDETRITEVIRDLPKGLHSILFKAVVPVHSAWT